MQIDFLKKIINSGFFDKKYSDLLLSEINELDSNAQEDKICPLCNEKTILFLPFNGRKYARCPKCGSLERHRFLFYYLNEFTNIFKEKIKFLHFAPEKVLFYKFDASKNIDYKTADLEIKPFVNEKIDMCSIHYDNNYFDVIMANHVLEHIPDDIKAMSELYRTIKPYKNGKGGLVFLMIPIFRNLKKTFENEQYNTPELRLKYFGQSDHVRKYGLDFKDRLESIGFDVTEIQPESYLDDNEILKYGLMKHDYIFVCKKRMGVAENYQNHKIL